LSVTFKSSIKVLRFAHFCVGYRVIHCLLLLAFVHKFHVRFALFTKRRTKDILNDAVENSVIHVKKSILSQISSTSMVVIFMLIKIWCVIGHLLSGKHFSLHLTYTGWVSFVYYYYYYYLMWVEWPTCLLRNQRSKESVPCQKYCITLSFPNT